ncbi:MAG: GTP cyclohydrolase I [Myxococcaceae bacterium]|nr:GTP cyclohydrolase I [Myxococcaceae bacterium]
MTTPAVDRAAMTRAIADFLTAAGHAPDQHPQLAETPKLVAAAWADEFLDGYSRDPLACLDARVPFRHGDWAPVVALDAIDFVSVCPHHLLPYRGVARVAYRARDWIVGFGDLVQCVDAFAHRLVLQEELAQHIAEGLCWKLEADAVFVRLEAEQNCLSLRGERRHSARAICEFGVGDCAGLREALR